MSSLTTTLIRRVLLIIPMMIGITLILFIVTHIVPASPLTVILNEKSLENPEAVKAATERWGLDKPLYVQYFIYLKNLAVGDMGESFKTKNPVSKDLANFFPATIELGLFSVIFAVLFGLPLGIIAALNNGKWLDKVSLVISLLGASMPPFWSGLVLLYILYYKMGWFPGPGRIDSHLTPPIHITGLFLYDSAVTGNWPVFWSSLQHLILPAIVLGWFELALICRVTRSSMLEVLTQDFIRTARGKGLSERVVVLGHALKNALIPVVTVTGLAVANLITGAIMTETIFSWPGIGRYQVEASTNLDFPALMGCTLAFALIYIVVNILVDVSYAIIDPRIRE
jgi:peptide/nickel transport system permease protein